MNQLESNFAEVKVYPFLYTAMPKIFLILLICFFSKIVNAQIDTTDFLQYIGGQGRVDLFDVFRIEAPGTFSHQTILLGGSAANLDWLPTSVLPANKRNQLPMVDNQGRALLSDSGGVGFIIHLSKDRKTILHLTHFPINSGTSVSRIRTTTRIGDPMGELYISGRRFVSDSGYVNATRFSVNGSFPKEEYFIARLNHNYVNGIPDSVIFYVNARCRYDYRNSNIHTNSQPWDVNTRGEVVYGEGATYIPVFNSFCYLRKVDPFGRNMVVPGWMMHVTNSGQIVYGNPAPPDAAYSMINGYMGKRGSWRSHTQQDFTFENTDANGNTRTGRYPDDFWYKRWVDPVTAVGEPSDIPTSPGNPTGLSAGPGRTGRVADHPRSYGFGAIVFDKLTNNLYVGFTVGYYWGVPADTTSKTQWDARHEFDPQVVAMDTNGFITGWDRLKKEASNDQPDSYLDALEIDYANRMLVVVGRQHGNDYNTSWIGNDLVANPTARGFKNSLNGTTGDIHIQWLGKYRLTDFKIFHSTFLAEYPLQAPILTPYTQPKYDGWQNQNADFLSIANTRRVPYSVNLLKVGRDGAVAICAASGRTMTTSDAFMKMVKPPGAAGGCNFVRVYSPDLSEVTYSSLLTSSPTFSNNVEIYGVLPEKDGVLVVGTSGALGFIPQKAPQGMNWSFSPNTSPTNPNGFFGRLTFDSTNFSVAQDTIVYPVIPVIAGVDVQKTHLIEPLLYPVPTSGKVYIQNIEVKEINVINLHGKVMTTTQNNNVDISSLLMEFTFFGLQLQKVLL